MLAGGELRGTEVLGKSQDALCDAQRLLGMTFSVELLAQDLGDARWDRLDRLHEPLARRVDNRTMVRRPMRIQPHTRAAL